MGATQSRVEDASLLLAVPKHTKIGPRRVLDPSCRKCLVCGSSFGFFAKKHYCRRCGRIVCEHCTVLKHYKERNGHGFRVCRRCDMIPIFYRVPQKVWHQILSFAGNVAHHRVIQLNRRSQLLVPLPYRFGASWDEFFTEGTFISRGANGSVYKAMLRNDPAKRQVAVKVVQKNTIFSLRKWHHIQREIDTLTACRTENIIELYNVFQSPEAVFIVLQFAHGGDLFDWLMSRKAPSEFEVKPIARQLLSTLYFMHDIVGAVHRDIKPENILLEKKARLGETPQIRLADFGFARLFPKPRVMHTHSSAAQTLVPKAVSEHTVAATPCGTLGFAAPEIIVAYTNRKEAIERIQGQEKPNKKGPASPEQKDGTMENPSSPITPVDNMKKMDIFAAGVTLCILLTGCEPFPCHNSKVHLDAVHSGAKFMGRHWEHVSNEAKQLLKMMLSPHAARRPTAIECLQARWLSSGTTISLPRKKSDADDTIKSFQMSLRTLRKNDPHMFVPDKSGVMHVKQRMDVVEDTLLEEETTFVGDTLNAADEGAKSERGGTPVSQTGGEVQHSRPVTGEHRGQCENESFDEYME